MIIGACPYCLNNAGDVEGDDPSEDTYRCNHCWRVFGSDRLLVKEVPEGVLWVNDGEVCEATA